MYFDEDMLLDIRLNILNKYVSKFVITEALYTHSGNKRNLRFDMNKFSKFKNKIQYIVVESEPDTIEDLLNHDTKDIVNSKIINNALRRENHQRNQIKLGIKNCDNDDLIIISDIDEIPNLTDFQHKGKVSIFLQKMFYYKFNLKHPNLIWTGSKACKKKELISPQWLRNIKPKKYNFWRLDTFFSKKKYINVNFIENGGWHFTNIKKAADIHYKLLNSLHHLEYEESKISLENLKTLINEKKIMYNHNADKKEKKWKSSISLNKIEINELPKYLVENKSRYLDFFD